MDRINCTKCGHLCMRSGNTMLKCGEMRYKFICGKCKTHHVCRKSPKGTKITNYYEKVNTICELVKQNLWLAKIVSLTKLAPNTIKRIAEDYNIIIPSFDSKINRKLNNEKIITCKVCHGICIHRGKSLLQCGEISYKFSCPKCNINFRVRQSPTRTKLLNYQDKVKEIIELARKNLCIKQIARAAKIAPATVRRIVKIYKINVPAFNVRAKYKFDILKYWGLGHSSREISNHLKISIHVVYYTLSNEGLKPNPKYMAIAHTEKYKKYDEQLSKLDLVKAKTTPQTWFSTIQN